MRRVFVYVCSVCDLSDGQASSCQHSLCGLVCFHVAMVESRRCCIGIFRPLSRVIRLGVWRGTGVFGVFFFSGVVGRGGQWLVVVISSCYFFAGFFECGTGAYFASRRCVPGTVVGVFITVVAGLCLHCVFIILQSFCNVAFDSCLSSGSLLRVFRSLSCAGCWSSGAGAACWCPALWRSWLQKSSG